MPDESIADTFQFDGRQIPFRPGQTVAGALFDAGQHVLSRSFKYHRPRGLFCASGRCPNCLCTVDGTPNERICTLPAAPGLKVASQNAWPSVRFDVLRLLELFDRFMPVGFYYKRMYRPRWMWPIYERFIRRVAGLGKVDTAGGASGDYDKQNLFADVAVVGGGWAGLHAALAAARAGAQVALIDDQPALGGHMRHDPELAGQALGPLIEAVSAQPGMVRLSNAVCFGLYEGNYLGIQQNRRLLRLRARQVIVCTGGWERPLVFQNNDLPGVLLASAAQRLMHLDGCRFDGAALVVTDNAQGYRVARQLAASGTRIAAVVDVRAAPSESAGPFDVLPGQTIVEATGRGHVTGAKVGPVGGGPTDFMECRWIIQAVGFTPANALLYQAGCRLVHDVPRDAAVVERFAPGTHAAGAVNGAHDPARVALLGRLAGLAAASALRDLTAASAAELAEVQRLLDQPAAPQAPAPGHYVSGSSGQKKFVCLCEDVTERDLCDAVAEGYSNIETLKRYSTVSMGPCQGKMCQLASIAICARQNVRTIAETGVTTARPPEQPVPLGVLAGRAVHLQLARQTPMHHWHVARGARMMDAGNWKRPQVYTSVYQEHAAVRQRAGLIDVSTLGKMELRGADVVRFLEFIYPNRFGNLAVGRIRYGVVCDDAGILLDDGTISRLGPDRFFLTTTTGNADAMDSWFRSWLASRPHGDVQLTNVSASYAAMNLAGPKSRQVLEQLTGADVSGAAMPYLSATQIEVAGVPAIVLRIGFVGELGYEIHVPAQWGLFVWQAVMEAGAPHGIEPFGVEAQRLLRLEKKHLLPGVDTDALSNPIEADLAWIARLEKPDFVGRQALARVIERGPRSRLVGFKVHGRVAPEPASLIRHRGRLAGRVTSCGYSPIAGATIGLAWVPAELAREGEPIQIDVAGVPVQAVVQLEAFYDPTGERLRS